MTAKPLKIDYDESMDTVEIEGQKYSGDFFRFMGPDGPPVGTVFRIAGRTADFGDGLSAGITIETVNP